jgi:hypothetical protein
MKDIGLIFYSFIKRIKRRKMAEFKRRKLFLSNGKHIKLFGNSMAITPNLEIGEGYAPNIFSGLEVGGNEKSSSSVSNPQKLTAEDLQELADYNIRLWLQLKDNIRKYGVNNAKVFGGDNV